MANRKFSASIRRYGDRALEKAEIILRSAVQDVITLAQTPQASVKETGGSFEIGKIPVDDGFLINSLQTSLNGSLSGVGKDSYLLAISELKLGDTIEFRWTEEYALRIEFGFVGTDSAGRSYNQAGRYFATTAAQQWSRLVKLHSSRVT